MGGRWGLLLALTLLTAAGAEQPDPLAPWLNDTARAVAAAGARRVAVVPLDGVVGRYLSLRLAAALGDRLVDPAAVAAALRTVPSDQLSDPARLAPVVADLHADAVLSGTAQPAGDTLRVELCLLRLPGGAATALPAASLPLDADLLALLGQAYATDEQRGMRPQLKDALQLAHAPGDRLPPAMDPSLPFRLELLVDGVPRLPKQHGHDALVRLSPGESYTLRVSNRSGERVGVALFVDGLNSVGQQRERPSAGLKWILEAGQTLEVAGWQLGDLRRAFTVVGAADSVAGRLGLTEQLGLITASFYAEAVAPQVGGEERRDLPIGTGAGDTDTHTVTRVKFKAADPPAATLALRYEVNEAKIGE